MKPFCNKCANMLIGCLLLLTTITGCGGEAPPSAEQWQDLTFWKSVSAEEVKKGLTAGLKADMVFSNGHTPLNMAALFNESPEVIEELIWAGASTNVSQAGMSPLMTAVANNPNPEIVKTLLKHGADVNAKGNNGISAILLAAESCKNLEIFKAIVDGGGNLRDKLDNGASVNDLAMKNIWAGGKIREYLSDIGVVFVINQPAIDEFIIQCRLGPLSRCREMISAGILLNRYGSRGELPLNVALNADLIMLDKVKLLLESGADPNLQDSSGVTAAFAFMQKIYGQEIYLAKIKISDKPDPLKEAFPEIDFSNTRRQKAADSTRAVFFDVFNLLKAHGLNFSAIDKEGNNLLNLAVMSNASDEVIRYFVANGVDYNAENTVRKTETD